MTANSANPRHVLQYTKLEGMRLASEALRWTLTRRRQAPNWYSLGPLQRHR